LFRGRELRTRHREGLAVRESRQNSPSGVAPIRDRPEPERVIFALLSTIVSAVFAVLVLARFARRRRSWELLWGVGLLMFAIAAGAGYLARTGGATEAEYRLFYLFGAILNVAWLALGTVALLAPRATRAAVAAVALLSVVAAYAVFVSPVDLSAAIDTGRGFQESPLPRIFAGLGSGVGSVVLIGGALWSAWVYFRHQRNGRRAIANVLIAAGVLVAAIGGTATFAGGAGLIEATNLIGISLMFVGFLIV
jgi:hypothetical protein